MAAEALIVEDAYQKGYADAMADMRKKKEQRRQREQEKKARRWYFIKQKAYGLAMLVVTVLAVWATEGDITIAVITVPLGLMCLFSKQMLIVIVDCYNEGDVSTGMRIRFTALGTVSNPILLNVDTEEFIQINATMKTGDVIEINTKYGSKGAKLIRDGVETDYFRYIDVDSTFMQLAIGDNMFRYDAASGVNSLEVSIFYSKEFLGV